MLGNIIVILAVVVIAVLAARSLWKSHKAGGQCTGNCASCGGHCNRETASKPIRWLSDTAWLWLRFLMKKSGQEHDGNTDYQINSGKHHKHSLARIKKHPSAKQK